MLGVGRPRCVAPGCTTQPSFNFPGTPACGAEYCGPHKLHGMVDVANPHCAHGACTLLDLCPGAWHACLNVHVLLATSDWRLAGHDGGTLTLSAQDVLAEGFCCTLAQMGAPNMSPSASWAGVQRTAVRTSCTAWWTSTTSTALTVPARSSTCALVHGMPAPTCTSSLPLQTGG